MRNQLVEERGERNCHQIVIKPIVENDIIPFRGTTIQNMSSSIS